MVTAANYYVNIIHRCEFKGIPVQRKQGRMMTSLNGLPNP